MVVYGCPARTSGGSRFPEEGRKPQRLGCQSIIFVIFFKNSMKMDKLSPMDPPPPPLVEFLDPLATGFFFSNFRSVADKNPSPSELLTAIIITPKVWFRLRPQHEHSTITSRFITSKSLTIFKSLVKTSIFYFSKSVSCKNYLNFRQSVIESFYCVKHI